MSLKNGSLNLLRERRTPFPSIELGVDLLSLDTFARIRQLTIVPMALMAERVDSKQDDDGTLSRTKLILNDLS